ncbi:S-adenosyl-L-methionine-dependent methyltransferase [Trichoderma gracile]
MMTEVQTPQMYLAQARACGSVQDCMSLYDKWAATYNDEVGDKAQEYVAPEIVAQVALRSSQDLAQYSILDAGCGTGLVGQALAQVGAKAIDGLDLSPAMLKIAKQTGVYRNLFQADLTQRVQQPEGVYDLVTCVGTFTNGHVGPDPALREFVRLAKKGGTVIATVLEEFWETAKFDVEVEKLAAEKVVEIVAQDVIDYVKGHGDKAVVVILRKL